MEQYDLDQARLRMASAQRARRREQRFSDLSSEVHAGKLHEEEVFRRIAIHDQAQREKRAALHQQWQQQVGKPIRNGTAFHLRAKVRPRPQPSHQPRLHR